MFQDANTDEQDKTIMPLGEEEEEEDFA